MDEHSQQYIIEPINSTDLNDKTRKLPKIIPAIESSYDNDMIQNNDNIRKPTKGTPPPDGGWGWMVVLGSFFTYFIASGIVYSFGIFYIEFLDFYKCGRSETAWVDSLMMGMMLLVGPFASALINLYGCRATTFVGATIAASGFILSMFSPNLYFLFFSFGIISGLGFGLIYLPSIVIIGQYFEKRRSLAFGLSMSGSGFGVFVFSPVSKYLIDEYGWRGALLLEAGFILNCAVCGALFRPLNSSTPSVRGSKHSLLAPEDNSTYQVGDTTAAGEKTEDCETARVNGVHSLPCEAEHQIQHELWVSVPFGQDGNFDSTLPKSTMVPNNESTPHGRVEDTFPNNRICCLNYLVRAFNYFKQTFDFSLLKNNIFLIYLVSNFCASVAMDAPIMFLADRALSAGISVESSKWILSCGGICTIVGKVIAGFISDFRGVKRLYSYISVLIIAGVSTALCPLYDTFSLLLIFGCVVGLFFGAYMPLTSIVLIDLVGEEMMSNGLGLCLMFKGIAILVGPPLSGWIYDITGNYDTSYIFSGSLIAMSGVILFSIPVMNRYTKPSGKP